MKLELPIDYTKKLSVGALPALKIGISNRLSKQFNNSQLTINRTTNDGLTIFGGDKKDVDHIVQETLDTTIECFY
ncbi:DinI family protein [Enterobacter bugandensis]|uniref:DinI-like family protein n=1 Tax=Enterobacter bugandensis TaxID=881260 RepID=UPI001C99693A|nr:DinI-like family protein [Enterobacter bugandensis]MBY6289471.1 DinI family protein [Enterobacter bugandensis]